MKIAVFGSTGMLGSTVLKFFRQQPEYDLGVISRYYPDAASDTSPLPPVLRNYDYAINCIGIIKPRINERDSVSVQRAIRVNALFPHALAQAAETVHTRVIQIATDCVYSGFDGPYDELDQHDALDVYGKTKSLGEVQSPNVRHLRCSIIGPEPAGRPKDSLLEWFLGQPEGAKVAGYTNHLWNGITTLAFAKICHGMIQQGDAAWENVQPVRHVVPGSQVAKAELLKAFQFHYNRPDIRIEDVEAKVPVNRVLKTLDPGGNMALWQVAGYAMPPTIDQLIEEQAEWGRP